MNLFQRGEFKLASGIESKFKIECDALTDEDWETLAFLGSLIVPKFFSVIGVPNGGLKLAEKMSNFKNDHNNTVLVVDDVLTTGESIRLVINNIPRKYSVAALVAFNRNSAYLGSFGEGIRMYSIFDLNKSVGGR